MCFGDGVQLFCPCTNLTELGAEEGCENSLGVGALIEMTGSASLSNDDAIVHLLQAPAHQGTVLVQGATFMQVPFKDGILCTGNPTVRMEFAVTQGNGGVSSTISLQTVGSLAPGDLRYYQWWYRDPTGSPCGNGSNLSSGMQVLWQ